MKFRPEACLSAALLACVFLLSAGMALPAQAGGLVSLGGPLTEIVVALGEEERLVAVDSTSRHPAHLQDLPNVGYVRQLSAEAILSTAPDLVLVAPDAGPPAALEQLEAAGVTLVRVPDDPTPEGLAEKIRTVALALGRDAEGERLAREKQEELRTLQEELARTGPKPGVLFLLSVGRGAPLAAGSGTTVHALIEMAGGTNVLGDLTGYKPLNPEAASGLDPEVVAVTADTLEALGGEAALFGRPELASTQAARDRRLAVLDPLLLLGLGPRSSQAVRDLAAVLHPDAQLSETTTDQGSAGDSAER